MPHGFQPPSTVAFRSIIPQRSAVALPLPFFLSFPLGICFYPWLPQTLLSYDVAKRCNLRARCVKALAFLSVLPSEARNLLLAQSAPVLPDQQTPGAPLIALAVRAGPVCPIHDGLIVMSGYRAQPDRPSRLPTAPKINSLKNPPNSPCQPPHHSPKPTKPSPPLPISLQQTWQSYPTQLATLKTRVQIQKAAPATADAAFTFSP
jgi:hypothetical protein